MKIIVAGGGKLGGMLTRQLSAEGYDLTLIDANLRQLESSEERFDIMVVQGNCASMEVLEQADVREADLLIAVTGADEINLLCCMTAHGMNRRLHTIARVRNPEYADQIYKMRDMFALSMTVNPENQAAVEIERLYLARHGQTEFNVQGRIGGDPPLTARGRAQADALARHLAGKRLDWVFTSTRMRSHETAAPVLENHRDAHVMALREFDEIWAGDCENMLYSEIREKMPEVTAQRNANKYSYVYPNGESYAILQERVRRGLRRALFLAGNAPFLILGHQAINRVLLSLFLRQRTEDVPYIHIPQNQYYHIQLTPTRKLFERIPYDGKAAKQDTSLKDPQIYS